jgi:putative transposase
MASKSHWRSRTQLFSCSLRRTPAEPGPSASAAWHLHTRYTTEGKRVLIAVRLGQRESHEDWLDLGRDLTRRGLRSPWLVVSDGAPGLIKAIEELWPETDRGRCAVHRLRNILAKLPKRPELQERIRRAYWQALDEAADPEDAERRLRKLVTSLEREYPSAAACLAEDLPSLCIHLKYFPRLRKRFRSSNLLERSLEEVRRRTKVIGRFPGETSCLSLCWAVLDVFIAGARGLGLTDLEYQQVAKLNLIRQQRKDIALQKIA